MGDLAGRVRFDPARMVEAQMQLWQDYQRLWMGTTARLLHQAPPAAPVAEPEPEDQRFRDPEWRENPVFDYIKQAYLLNATWAKRMVESIDGLDDDTAQKVGLRQSPDRRCAVSHQLRVHQSRRAAGNEGAARGEPARGGRRTSPPRSPGARGRSPSSTFRRTRSRSAPTSRSLRARWCSRTSSFSSSSTRPRRRSSTRAARCSSCRPGSTSTTSWTSARGTRSSPGASHRATPCSWCRG